MAPARSLASPERDGALDAAGFSLGLDFLYLAAYSTALAGGCAGLAIGCRRRRWPAAAAAGVVLGWAAWVAGALDAASSQS